MLSVFACDDNLVYLNKLSNWIESYISLHELCFEFALNTTNPDEIIQKVKSSSNINGLYFLDIELGAKCNGIQVARVIRKYDPRAFIVFITSHPQYMPLTFEYRVEALDYISKVDKETIICKKVHACLQDAYTKHLVRANEECFTFKVIGGHSIFCKYSDILFFETDPNNANRLILHTKNRHYTFYNSLDKICKVLPSELFFRCHKSYIVNMNNLPKFNNETYHVYESGFCIIMQNGAECLVSRRQKGIFLESLEGYELVLQVQ